MLLLKCSCKQYQNRSGPGAGIDIFTSSPGYLFFLTPGALWGRAGLQDVYWDEGLH